MNGWLVASVGGGVFLASTALTRFLVGYLARIGAIDRPNERSSHETPTPRGGGLAVVICAGAGILVLTAIEGHGAGSILFSLGLAVAFAAIGALDDLRDLSVRSRLTASFLMAAGFVTSLAPEPGSVLALLQVLAGTVFIVGGANIYNFMDGIDGIAASTAGAAGTTMVAVGYVEGQPQYVIVGVALAAAATGFLTQNWSPASIFLGDVGSLFLGGTVTSMVLVAAFREPTSGLVLASPMLPFFVDGVLTLGRRWRRGDSVVQAHREHLYQRAAARWGHAPVSAMYTLAAASAGLGSAGSLLISSVTAVSVVIVSNVVWVLAWVHVDKCLRSESRHDGLRHADG